MSSTKYTLIIAEKPDAAKRIATALDKNANPQKLNRSGVPYFEAYRNGKILIVPAIGHLYTILSEDKGHNYPVFNYRWVPRWQAEKRAAKIRTWLRVITELSTDAEAFVDGCDFDLEGSIIGYTILKYACKEKQQIAKRMKYSTLTDEELQEAYTNLLPKLDFSLIEAGLTRHEVDWLYGINLSRALTQAVKKNTGQYATLSTGRVQGPTLRFLDEREKEVQCFVPTPFWKLIAKLKINGTIYNAESRRRIENQDEAKSLRDKCRTKSGIIEKIEYREIMKIPPVPFDLGSLQSEAYRLFHYTPMRTAKILQNLYTRALISYPRTSSQKLPPAIGYKKILKKISLSAVYACLCSELLSKPELRPNEGKKSDAAHPAIYPTGNLPKKLLDSSERNIFDLVVKRFLAVFGEPSILQNMNIIVRVFNDSFQFAFTRTLAEGWFRLYRPYVPVKEDVFPLVKEGLTVEVEQVRLNRRYTQPLPRYNPGSLLLKMEKEEIGTKATRAATIQTLQERKYLNGVDNLSISDLGFAITEVLENYCPAVVSTEMTRTLETQMKAIEEGKENKEEVLRRARETISSVIAQLKTNEHAIGTQLSAAVQKIRQEDRTIGLCNNCQNGKLLVLTSKKSGKRFVGCSNYFEGKCTTAYPLPQIGLIKPSGNRCKTCNAPIVKVYTKTKKPWMLCINTQCPTKGATVN